MSVAYAAYSKNDEIRKNSSSGGLFPELAKYVLDLDGYVSGAAWDKDFKGVSHIVIDDVSELHKLTTSKYLQSKFSIHKEIEEKLKNNDTVLCSGTPCQIASLKKYLKKDYDNLILVDIICHGTPMPKVWVKYLDWQEKKHGEPVTYVNFRNKEKGWRKYSVLMKFGPQKRYKKSGDKDSYMKLFLGDICLDRRCYECRYKGENRFSDITLGDFWGIEKVVPEIDDDKGVSILSLNTEKGRKVFDEIKNRLTYREVDGKEAFKHNLCAIQPVIKPARYEDFWADFDRMSYEELVKNYIPKQNIKQRLKKYRIVRWAISVRDRIKYGKR
ncbi:MAG: Coenzyme F420 hydrogenase/dehydrogenase, beta subunit C-terminal domain [Lachnospiraceae bacterium]|nr:Coenzyme F420 hydrogenase/dehydrogenase, beta subunit C-terminal domain [Lachnospiraceae bacterium]